MFLFILNVTPAFAALFINEFSADTAGSGDDPDWVEIYNSGSDSIDLSLYRLRDNTATNKHDLSGTISPQGFVVFGWSNKLNKDGDLIKLLFISDESVVDKVGYGDVGSDVIAPYSGQSAGRQNDGSSNWVVFSSQTRGSSNNFSDPVPTITPTLILTFTPMPSPTSSPTPTKTPIPTKTPMPTKSNTVTIAPTSLATTYPTPILKTNPTQIIDKNNVLGESVENKSLKNEKILESDDISPASVNGERGGMSVLSIVFIGSGSLLLISCGILFFRSNIISFIKRFTNRI